MLTKNDYVILCMESCFVNFRPLLISSDYMSLFKGLSVIFDVSGPL